MVGKRGRGPKTVRRNSWASHLGLRTHNSKLVDRRGRQWTLAGPRRLSLTARSDGWSLRVLWGCERLIHCREIDAFDRRRWRHPRGCPQVRAVRPRARGPCVAGVQSRQAVVRVVQRPHGGCHPRRRKIVRVGELSGHADHVRRLGTTSSRCS